MPDLQSMPSWLIGLIGEVLAQDERMPAGYQDANPLAHKGPYAPGRATDPRMFDAPFEAPAGDGSYIRDMAGSDGVRGVREPGGVGGAGGFGDALMYSILLNIMDRDSDPASSPLSNESVQKYNTDGLDTFSDGKRVPVGKRDDLARYVVRAAARRQAEEEAEREARFRNELY